VDNLVRPYKALLVTVAVAVAVVVPEAPKGSPAHVRQVSLRP
jgi:hypothetical protein